jgi:hypothetical protein
MVLYCTDPKDSSHNDLDPEQDRDPPQQKPPPTKQNKDFSIKRYSESATTKLLFSTSYYQKWASDPNSFFCNCHSDG